MNDHFSKPKTVNKMFRGEEPTWANACVGNNGFVNYATYAKGFSAGANLLLDQVIMNRGNKHPTDTFIYPICFSMRHAVELYLKGAIESTSDIANAKSIQLTFDLNTSHDIGLIWEYLSAHCISLDKRFTSYMSAMDDAIKDIAKIDPTGQTFRYPHDSEAKKHLVDTSIINVIVLKKTFNVLEENLERLDDYIHCLSEEYRFGTHTKNLSRAQLADVARSLPPIERWRDESFAEIKRDLKQRYSIGSAELSMAITIIKGHFELAQHIGRTVEFDGLLEADLITLFDHWIELHPERAADETDEFFCSGYDNISAQPSIREIVNYRGVAKESIESLVGRFSVNAISNIAALFELQRGSLFSEMFELNLEIEKKNLNDPEDDEGRAKLHRLSHLMRKTSLLTNVLKSLYYLGHAKAAELLIARYAQRFGACDLQEIRRCRPAHLTDS